jgi:hypothetical protein
MVKRKDVSSPLSVVRSPSTDATDHGLLTTDKAKLITDR